MTNKDIVRYALSKIRKYDGGKVNNDQLYAHIFANDLGTLTTDQVRRAMRDMKGVIKLRTDVYKVKGRSTPVKTYEDKTYPRMFWNSEKQGTYRKHKSVTKSTNPIYVGSVN